MILAGKVSRSLPFDSLFVRFFHAWISRAFALMLHELPFLALKLRLPNSYKVKLTGAPAGRHTALPHLFFLIFSTSIIQNPLRRTMLQSAARCVVGQQLRGHLRAGWGTPLDMST
jgi:hypothetical protein